MSRSTTLAFWHVPYQRNPFFTGREDVLNRLHQTLHAEHKVALSQPQGITGLGGIGNMPTAIRANMPPSSGFERIPSPPSYPVWSN
jgi:hypothetical protein